MLKCQKSEKMLKCSMFKWLISCDSAAKMEILTFAIPCGVWENIEDATMDNMQSAEVLGPSIEAVFYLCDRC